MTLLCGSNTEYTKGLFGNRTNTLYVCVDASSTAGDSAESPESTVDLHMIILGVYERGVQIRTGDAPFKANRKFGDGVRAQLVCAAHSV